MVLRNGEWESMCNIFAPFKKKRKERKRFIPQWGKVTKARRSADM